MWLAGHSLDSHTCVLTLCELIHTPHSLASIDFTFWWDWRASSAFASSLLHLVALVGRVTWRSSCYSWWLSSPSRLEVGGIVELSVIVVGSNQAIVKGFCARRQRRPRRATLECSWLVGVHHSIDSCGTQVVGLACHAISAWIMIWRLTITRT
jgi:hypothetical protein